MTFFKKAFSNTFYKSTFFWLLLSLIFYTLIGCLLLPILLKSTLTEQIQRNFNYQTTIENISINPFALTLTVDKLTINDQHAKNILSFDQYQINLELKSIIDGALHFADVVLLTPNIHIELDTLGVSNIQKAYQTQQRLTPDNGNQSEQKHALAKLFFQQISVRNGSITLLDERLGTAILHRLDPINFTLNNFSTYVQENGQYSLDIALGQQQKLTWQGSLALAPFRSQGQLSISNIDLTKLKGYFSQYNPYNLNTALLSIDGHYDFSLADDKPSFSVNDATITLDNIALSLPEDSSPLIEISKVLLNSLNFDLNKNNLQINKVKIADSQLALTRDKQGHIALLTAINALIAKRNNISDSNSSSSISVSTNRNTNKSTNSPEFTWSIGQLAVVNTHINFRDQQPEIPANITVHNINVSVSKLSQNLAHPLALTLNYFLPNSEENTFSGTITPQPFAVRGDVQFKKIDLTLLQPYVNEQAKVAINQGLAYLQGKVDISKKARLSSNFSGGFTGNLSIENFSVKDQLLQQKIVGWQHLSIQPFTLNVNPLSIDIDTISLVKPYTRLIITEQRKINLSNLLRQQPTTLQTVPPQQEKKTSLLNMSINKVTFADGGAFFADLSLTPQFGTSIQNINGTISGLSADNLERATVDLQGTIDKYGKMSVKGKINPLSGDLYTDINARFDKIELTTLTPYSGRYAGFVIDKGKLSLELNYQIANNQLSGSNRLILDHLEFGSPVNSNEAVSLPLKLALALFKDSNGIIDISLPTSGDINDPDFAFGGLVGKALMNIISKAVLSPFTMIANLAGGDAKQLSTVSFDLGSSLLSSEEFLGLDKLANILKSRPLLILEIRVNVDTVHDSEMLKELKIIQQLSQSITKNANQQQHITAMESLLTKRVSAEKVQALQASYQAKLSTIVDANNQQPTTKSKAIALSNYQQSLQQALLASERISSLELTSLAKARIENIKNYLVEQSQVPHEQVFALQPTMSGNAENNQIVTTFTLASH